MPPVSGTRPILLKAWMKLATGAAITRSQFSARLAPAPAATPLTAAITGTGIDAQALDQRLVIPVDHVPQVLGRRTGREVRRDSGIRQVLARRRSRGRRR